MQEQFIHALKDCTAGALARKEGVGQWQAPLARKEGVGQWQAPLARKEGVGQWCYIKTDI